jgi:hypothetical protein
MRSDMKITKFGTILELRIGSKICPCLGLELLIKFAESYFWRSLVWTSSFDSHVPIVASSIRNHVMTLVDVHRSNWLPDLMQILDSSSRATIPELN